MTLEQTRQRYRFVVVGYVVMPEHIHLLLTEPEIGTPSTVMQVLKQRTARDLLPKKKRADSRQRELFADGASRRAFWQASRRRRREISLRREREHPRPCSALGQPLIH